MKRIVLVLVLMILPLQAQGLKRKDLLSFIGGAASAGPQTTGGTFGGHFELGSPYYSIYGGLGAGLNGVFGWAVGLKVTPAPAKWILKPMIQLGGGVIYSVKRTTSTPSGSSSQSFTEIGFMTSAGVQIHPLPWFVISLAGGIAYRFKVRFSADLSFGFRYNL